MANDIVAGLGFGRGFNLSLITTVTTSVYQLLCYKWVIFVPVHKV